MSGLLKPGFVFRMQLELLLAFAEKHVGHKPGFAETRLLVGSAADANPALIMEQFYKHMCPMERELKERDPKVITHFETLPFFKTLGLSDQYSKSTDTDRIELWSLLTTLYFLAMQAGDIGTAIAGSLGGLMGQMGVDMDMRAPGKAEEIEQFMNGVMPKLTEFLPIMANLASDLDSGNPPTQPAEGEAEGRMEWMNGMDLFAGLGMRNAEARGQQRSAASIRQLPDSAPGDATANDPYSTLF